MIKIAPQMVDEKKVAEEKKKLEAAAKKKKKGEEEEPEVLPPNPLEVLFNLLQAGNRILTNIPVHFNLPQLVKTGLEYVPAPIYPDPGPEFY